MKIKCSQAKPALKKSSKQEGAKFPGISDRLLACLESDKIKDLELIGNDGIKVPALRCVLGSASPVLETMLYGKFAESTKSVIHMGEDCSSKALQALVEFCCSDQLNIGNKSVSRWKDSTANEMIEDLMAVARLGHTYALPALVEAVLEYLLPRLQEIPSLACLVYEGSHPLSTPELYSASLKTIQEQPYLALKQNEGDGCGGIVCLSTSKLEEVL